MVVLPAVAGLAESTRRYEESWMAPAPVPWALVVKMAGAKAATFTAWACAGRAPFNVAARP
jgi:hypothetical protein